MGGGLNFAMAKPRSEIHGGLAPPPSPKSTGTDPVSHMLCPLWVGNTKCKNGAGNHSLTKTTALVLIPSRKKKVSAFVPLQKKSAGTHFFTEKNMPVLRYRTKVTILAPLYKKMCRYAFFYRKSAGTNSFKERNTGTLSFTKKKYSGTSLRKNFDSTSPLTEKSAGTHSFKTGAVENSPFVRIKN